MKVYKKRAMQFTVSRESVVFISHPMYSRLKNRSVDAVKISKWSLMHSLIGLTGVLQGSLMFVPKESERKFVDIEEVIIGDRVIPYEKYVVCYGEEWKMYYIIRCLH